MRNIVAVIPARGGSKGIPGKNIIPICGKPLLAWSILHAKRSKLIDSVWVSSDSNEILTIAESYGAIGIKRPESLSGDTASSESAWQHSLDVIAAEGISVDLLVGLQPTSPIREPADLDNAIIQMEDESLDSLLSVTEVEDFFNWRVGPKGPEPLNYDYKSRLPRQNIEKRFLENGSFYLSRPIVIKNLNNRLGGKIGLYLMDKYKMFQIDNPDDVRLCEAVMHAYGLNS